MRPLTLSLTAFGPFAGTAVVDFERLSAHSLFLIHGPTGAGKTSLLDGLVYALYGQTSGGDRSPRDVRSHHAPDRVRTEVRLTFEVRGKVYEIRRAPEQERPKRRGEGVTLRKMEVELRIRRTDVDSGGGPKRDQPSLLPREEDAFVTLATKANDVEEQVVTLLGLTADQFRQVVVLPQGRFREFLLAPSRDRQAILESLFHTERYREIERVLHDETERLAAGIRDVQKRRAILLEQAGVESADALEAARVGAKAAVAALEEERARRADAREATRLALEEGRESQRRLDELATALAETTTLDAEAPRVDDHRAALLLDEKARAAHPALAAAREAAQQLAEARARAERNLDVAKGLEAALARAVEEDAKAREAATEQPELERRRAELDERLLRLADLEAAETAHRDAVSASETAAAARREREAAVEKASEIARARQRALDEARLGATQVEHRRAAYVELLKVRQTTQRLDEVRTLLDERNAELSMARQRADGEVEVVGLAEAARDRAEDAWLKDRAAHLAAALVDDGPCPVCGSTVHPAPAAARRGSEGVSERTVRERRQALESSRARLETARAEVSRLAAEAQSLEKERALLLEQLGDRADLDVEAEIDRAGARLEEAETAFDNLDGLRAAASEAERMGESERASLEEAKAAEARARVRLAETRAVLDERSAGLAGEAAGGERLAAARDELSARIAALAEAVIRGERARADAERDLAAARAAADESAAEAERAATSEKSRAAALARARKESGFADDAALEAALLSTEERARLAVLVRDFDQRLLGAQGRLVRAKLDAEGRAPPDLLRLSEAAEAAEVGLDQALRALGEASARDERLEALSDEVQKARDDALGQGALHAVYARLDEVTRGENAYRMNLQRFVLATLLDEVLETASARLARMSRGRYLLRRAEEASGRRRARGLELSVFDNHTGTERSVSTLSGGESFLAALALALGLADAVMARAGGRLDAIFVDEGFGGLDPEALDLALEALTRLHDGHRVVGIISHVDELKERVETRLEVVSSQRGSRLRTEGTLAASP